MEKLKIHPIEITDMEQLVEIHEISLGLLHRLSEELLESEKNLLLTISFGTRLKVEMFDPDFLNQYQPPSLTLHQKKAS